jgi:site-specific DNA recombinase
VLLANDYRNKISDNVKRSVKKKLEEGTILGDSPLGYLNSKRGDKKKEKVEVCIDPMRGDLVRKIFEEYASGMYSMSEICSMITEEGLRSKKGCKVSKSQVEKMLKNPFYYGYMQYYGILYKHVHPVLISKELFDECQKVRTGRRKTKFKRTEKSFFLKGFLKCHHCGCSYSPEIKKGKYVYMRPTKSKGDCSYCYHLSEKKILSQIEHVLKGMKIPDHILVELNDELRQSSNKEHVHQREERKRLQGQYQAIQNRVKRARELLLDMAISKEEYDDIMTELQAERHNVEVRLQRLNNADDHFNKAISTIFTLASKAHDLFKSSEVEEKRRIIAILFPNLEMDAATLVFKPRKPFDMFLNVPDRLKWLPFVEHYRTICMMPNPQAKYVFEAVSGALS